MCLAIPGEIINIENSYADVDIMGVETRVNIDLIEHPSIGDYVLIHTGFAIERIDIKYFTYLKEVFEEILSGDISNE